MLYAMQGYVKNNQIVTDAELAQFEGMKLVVTFLNEKKNTHDKKMIDFSNYGHRTERGQNVDKYMEEMRANDRI